MAQNAFAGIEDKDDEHLLGWIKPVGLGDVSPPIGDSLVRGIGLGRLRETFPDAHDLELVRGFHSLSLL